MKTIHLNKAVIVGIFIFLAIVIFITAVFTIGGQQKTFVKTVNVNALFYDIGGLQEGNNVWLYGVKIGTIKKINFYGNNQVEVSMNIIKSAQSRIHKDSKAKIGSDGLIGNKIVIIYGGTNSTIEDNDYLQTESTLGSDEILATLQANNKNLLEITDDMKVVSKTIKNGEGTIGKLINDPSIADNMNMTIKNFEVVSSNSEKAIQNLNTFIAGLNKPGVLANELVTDTTVFSSLKQTMAQLEKSASGLTKFTENLETASEGLTEDNTPAGMLLNNKEVAVNLKTLTQNLTSSSEKLDEDLEAIQHNFLFRGYFRRLDKQKKKDQENKKDSLPSATN